LAAAKHYAERISKQPVYLPRGFFIPLLNKCYQKECKKNNNEPLEKVNLIKAVELSYQNAKQWYYDDEALLAEFKNNLKTQQKINKF
jgi:hypothetical protein